MPTIRHRRGSAVVLAIVVAVALTALVSVLAWVAGANAQQTSNLSKVDQAFFAAEAGARRVEWYCKHYKMSSISSPLTGSVNGCSYSVSWSTVSGNTILIQSTASNGSSSYTLSEQATPPFISQATITSVGVFDNKNITVTGEVAATSYTNSGGGVLTGNLTWYSSATNTNSVSGTVTHATDALTTIDFDALGTALTAVAGRTYTGDQNGKTFDFTLLSGSHKVIVVQGNVDNPTFIGSGTLYVTGKITHAGNYGSAANPVDLVAQDDITTNNGVTIYGSIYTKGDWNRGSFDLTGMIYTGGIIKSNNGQSTLTQTTTPWWDPRASGGVVGGSSTSTTAVSNFSGPMP